MILIATKLVRIKCLDCNEWSTVPEGSACEDCGSLNVKVVRPAMPAIPETCPGCGAKSNGYEISRSAHAYECGSTAYPEFSASPLCSARQEIAALKIDVALWRKTSGEAKDVWDNCVDDLAAMRHRAEKAEAERDKAWGVVRSAIRLVSALAKTKCSSCGCNCMPGQTCSSCEAQTWLDALPEWAREPKPTS